MHIILQSVHKALVLFRWHSGLVVEYWTCNHLGRGFDSYLGQLCSNLEQVVHTYVLCHQAE